jgi:hypothetical protein
MSEVVRVLISTHRQSKIVARCENCKREYVTTASRAIIKKLKFCHACNPSNQSKVY